VSLSAVVPPDDDPTEPLAGLDDGGLVGDDAHSSGDELRRWLALLRRPDLLADTTIIELLRVHGRMPQATSAREIGRAAAQMLRESIERLRAPGTAPREQQLPYLVLKTCFVDGLKLYRAAVELGISERQLSRERARAIALLRSELALAEQPEPAYRPESIPAIADYIARPGLSNMLSNAIESHRRVHVQGPPGIGKTALVAEVGAEVTRQMPVFWLRFRGGVNDSLSALLFELGEHQREQGDTRLADYMAEALPAVDIALATRLALRGFPERPHLLVFDDYHLAADVPGIAGLIDEMATRLPAVRVVTVSRHREVAAATRGSIAVPAFTRDETASLLVGLGAATTDRVVSSLHRWTEGIPHLIKLAAAWVKTADPDEVSRGTDSLNDLDEVQDFLLGYITEMLDVDDRDILDAACVFRERFTDDALAHVAARTRGEVQDASRRLVRVYIATRGRDGDCSFFHTSVRDYLYQRLDPARRAELHRRAGEWFERRGDAENARYHGLMSERS
jgi:ATP/maltotriose-dependent transcriptional regulator MalT